MTRRANQTPTYLRQKRSGQADSAFTVIDGQRIHLGTHDSKESRRKYNQLIAEWLSNDRQLIPNSSELTITELLAIFWKYAQQYYRHPDGTPTSEPHNFAEAMKPLNALYGELLVCEFSPKKLKAVRQCMIDKGWCRSNINTQVGRIRRIFKYAVENELVEPSILHGLQAVAPLKRGRTNAKESKPVKPVADSHVEATLEFLTPTLQAMVKIQRLTGMRPGEVCNMRTCDIDATGTQWIYTPSIHKTQHHNKNRTIYIGQRAIEILRPRLKANLDAYIFSPADSERERRQQQHEQRETPISCGNKPGSNKTKKPKKVAGNKYDTCSYNKAISYACRAAFPAPDGCKGEQLKDWRKKNKWSPNQLRHTYATEIRKEFGLEASQLLLGHSSAAITDAVYAERDQDKIKQVVASIG